MSQSKTKKNQIRKAPVGVEVFYDEDSQSQINSKSSIGSYDHNKPFSFSKVKKGQI